MPPEENARQNIDRQLTECGWLVQDAAEMNILAEVGVAVREFPITVGESEDSEALPDPDVLAEEIADDLEATAESFRAVARGIKR